MKNLDQLIDQYQISKTLRFGLTLKEKNKKEGYEGDIHKSHSQLENLIKYSEEKIIEKVNKNKEITTFIESELPLQAIRQCLDDTKKYISDWEQFHTRYDQIAVLKDFYRKLERKARFDGFWMDKKSIR
ncbi:MAG: hypothetical protein LBC20_08115 [Planctomycetaceae bacterium]|jgi:hypothetical protein|nr:hypothetical protein [Planctomycetaceae bacterium]